MQVIQAVNAGGGLFADALDRGLGPGEETGGFLHPLGDLQFDDFLFLGLRNGDDLFPRLGPRAQKDVKRSVATIIKDHVRADSIRIGREHEGPVKIVPMLGQGLALDGKDRDAGCGNGGGGMVLGREDVARRPAHIGTKGGQRLNQGGGLDRHVQRAYDARTLQRLCGAKLFAAGHQARHFGFGDGQFLAAKLGQRDILDDVIHVTLLPSWVG